MRRDVDNKLRAVLRALEADAALDGSAGLRQRFLAIDEVDALLPHAHDSDLRLRAQRLLAQIESINDRFYESVREEIRHVRRSKGMAEWTRWLGLAGDTAGDEDGYDLLDEIVGGVLRIGEPQMPSVELAHDMVFYQPTPARHVFELLRKLDLREGDVLVDLGSGLGHVPLLTAICTPASAIGIEIEPAFVACAQDAASSLHLDNVRFVESDARQAEFSVGNVFYLYTPFKGEILRGVLARLFDEAANRPIRICSLGPCTDTVADQPWLVRAGRSPEGGIAVFDSVPFH